MYGSYLNIGSFYEKISFRHFLQHYSGITRTIQRYIVPVGSSSSIAVKSLYISVNGKSRFEQLVTASSSTPL